MAQKSKHLMQAEAHMKTLGIYKPEFMPMLEVYAQLMTQRDALEKKYKASGYAFQVSTNTGFKKAPIVTTLETLRKDILVYANALGLTPQGLAKFDDKAFSKKPEASGLDEAMKALENFA